MMIFSGVRYMKRSGVGERCRGVGNDVSIVPPEHCMGFIVRGAWPRGQCSTRLCLMLH